MGRRTLEELCELVFQLIESYPPVHLAANVCQQRRRETPRACPLALFRPYFLDVAQHASIGRRICLTTFPLWEAL